MKVAVSASAPSLDSPVDPRFGRCAYFIIVDTDTMQYEAIQNPAQYAGGGAGIQAAQIIANKGVKAVLTGNVGPNAFQALSAAGIQIVCGVYGTVREAVIKFKRGEIGGVSSPTVPMHYGMGGGYGRGRSRGMGMGMRYGVGMPQQTVYPAAIPPAPPMTKEQEIQMLKDQMRMLQEQLENIKKRLKELKKE
ncbi:MAG TPA: dinitrogenase iron-molybdenum cofactor biosynthesis protein [Candidatus Bathyarchaeota archaeon]|nr:dinitrogenase iron-molybdenum cofactor biosynthesis protein [Candidatus Bathyarchaeota archaeon]